MTNKDLNILYYLDGDDMKYFKFFLIIIIFIFIFLFIDKIFFYDRSSLYNLIDINTNKSNYIFDKISTSFSKFNTNNILSFLDLDVSEYINKSNEITYINNSPIVYIYNTHEKEEYVDYDVKSASYYLKDKLLEYGIYSIVEDKSINDALYDRGLDYKYAYDISLEYLEEKVSLNKNLKYFIDIHRDSADRSITYKDNNYASIMFILCTNYDNYKDNEINIKKLESNISNINPNILRDTYIQEKYDYNLSYSSNSFLIELGGPENLKNEVINSIDIFAKALSIYIKENYE